VEYVVETTAKCNLYCRCVPARPMQPKKDMTDEIFTRLVAGRPQVST
jgi:hypothetical protein